MSPWRRTTPFHFILTEFKYYLLFTFYRRLLGCNIFISLIFRVDRFHRLSRIYAFILTKRSNRNRTNFKCLLLVSVVLSYFTVYIPIPAYWSLLDVCIQDVGNVLIELFFIGILYSIIIGTSLRPINETYFVPVIIIIIINTSKPSLPPQRASHNIVI